MTDSDFTVRKGLLVRDGNVSLRGDNKELRFYEGANYVGFEAPALSADKIWVLPAADGSTGQALKTDGSGNLGWVTAGDVTLTGTQTLTNKTLTTPNLGTPSAIVLTNATGTAANLTAGKVQTNAGASGNQYVAFMNDGLGIGQEMWFDDQFKYNPSTNVLGGGLSIDTTNILISGGQGSDGDVLTSTGSGVAWEAVSGGASDIDGLSDGKTSDNFSIGLGLNALYSITDGQGHQNIAFGVNAGYAVTVADNNTLIGARAGSTLDSNDNTAVGYQALRYGTGVSNTMIGANAGEGTSGSASGANNTMVGKSAGFSYTTGASNTLIGVNAGQYITTGGSNIAIGVNALERASTETNNISIGNQSMGGAYGQSATGAYNVAIGTDAARYGFQANGGSNVAIGKKAMYGSNGNSSAASYNVSIGVEAIEAITTGDYNVGVGYKSLEANTTGSRNVAIGANSLDAITTHSNLTAVGHNAGTAVTSSNNLTAIGYESANALTSQIECTYVGYHSGNGATGTHNTGIGMNAGKSITGNFNVAVGRNVAYFGGDMDMTTAIGCEAGFFWGNTPTVHDYTVAVGYQAGYKGGTNSTYVGAVTAYNQTGAYSVAVGYQALRSTMGAGAGAGNTAIGTQSMYGGVGAISGANNTFTGYKSGYLVSSGTGNAGFGYEALDNVRDGSKNIAIGYQSGDSISSGSNNVVIGKADVADATASDQLSISSGDGSPVWMTSDSTGVVDFPNGLTNNGAAIESSFETITDVTIGSGTSGTTSGIYFGANNEAGVVAGEISNQSVASDGYIELMNCDLDAESGASGLQTIELTVQIQDETNNNVESFKALVQGIEKTVLGTTVREVNYTEWAIIYSSGANRIGQLEADYDSSDDTIRIRYKHTQSSTATLTATFYAVTMQNNT
jgi:hypothetical protein